jgi:hypothetical protein
MPTVSTSVGNHLRDYGEFAGSRVEEEEELRDATFADITWNALKQGYYNSLYGKESYKGMMGWDNEKQQYEDILAGEDYQFEADSWLEKGVSGVANQIGQQFSQWTDPRSLAAAGAGATGAFVLGNAGPQALIPEEIITVPGATIAGIKAGSTMANFEIEAGGIGYRVGSRCFAIPLRLRQGQMLELPQFEIPVDAVVEMHRFDDKYPARFLPLTN